VVDLTGIAQDRYDIIDVVKCAYDITISTSC